MKSYSLKYERDLHYAMGARAERQRIRRAQAVALLALRDIGHVRTSDLARQLDAATRAPKRSRRPGKGA